MCFFSSPLRPLIFRQLTDNIGHQMMLDHAVKEPVSGLPQAGATG
jgi:hypothetical protein